MVEGLVLPGMVGSEWAPARSDDYNRDCTTGREHAAALMAIIGEQENPALFGTIVRAITAAGKFEGVEVGFCSAIGIQLLVGVGGAA